MSSVYDSNVYRATLKRVVDGDTIVLVLDLGCDILHVAKLRLLDVDTPEKYGVKKWSEEYCKGLLSTNFTAAWLYENTDLYVRLRKKGKYGRYLAHVYSGLLKDTEGNVSFGPCLNEAIAEYVRTQDEAGWPEVVQTSDGSWDFHTD